MPGQKQKMEIIASLFVLLVLTVFKISGTLPNNNEQYTYRFVAVDGVQLEAFPNERDDLKVNKHKLVKTVQDNFQLSKLKLVTAVPGEIQNLYSTLKGFQNDHCQLVIDNWQGLNIKQTAVVPIMLRKLKQVLSHRKLRVKGQRLEYLDAVMMPTNHHLKQTFSRYNLTQSKYHNCPISSFYYPLKAKEINDAFCVDLTYEKFLLKSKPWQCEIQVNLLMPEYLLKFHNFPRLFRYNFEFDFRFLPSSRPNIYVFLDFKSVQEIGSRELLEWISRKKHSSIHMHPSWFTKGYWVQNNVYLSGHVFSNVTKAAQTLDQTHTILGLTRINLCADCPNLMLFTSMKQNTLSFEFLASDNKGINILWYGVTTCPDSDNVLSLCKQIEYFQTTKYDTSIAPLKNIHKINTKYLNSVQVLAFAFTSVFAHLLGNHTTVIENLAEKQSSIGTDVWNYLTPRSGCLAESLFYDPNVALHFQNKFGSLRFVSCGSRGLEDLQIGQFVSVFENKIWKCMLAVAIILTIAMNVLSGSMFLRLYTLDKVICLIMVVLEQGNPFPERFIRSSSFRFLIFGTLLGGLVLSNSFKSTNVYNIVLPRGALKFGAIDELLVHGYNVYSKLAKIEFLFLNFENETQTAEVFIDEYELLKLLILASKEGEPLFGASVETIFYMHMINEAPKNLVRKEKSLVSYLMNKSGPHPGLRINIVDSLK